MRTSTRPACTIDCSLQLAELLRSQHVGGDASLLQAWELRGKANPLDAGCVEGVAGAGAQSALVKDVLHVGIDRDGTDE